MKRLQLPAAIAFTVVAGTTSVAAISSLAAGCGHGESPTDGQVSDGGCALFCIPDPTSDAGVCPDPPPCANDMGECPAGCRPVG